MIEMLFSSFKLFQAADAAEDASADAAADIYNRKDVIGLRIISQSTSERCVQSGDWYPIGL